VIHHVRDATVFDTLTQLCDAVVMQSHDSFRFVLSVKGTTPHYFNDARKAHRVAAEFRDAGYDVFVIDRNDVAAGTDWAGRAR
jgi:hypothetical protein